MIAVGCVEPETVLERLGTIAVGCTELDAVLDRLGVLELAVSSGVEDPESVLSVTFTLAEELKLCTGAVLDGLDV